ncbi:MAG: cobalt ECF transporter T component CbiQ [bacterium]
MNKVGKNLFDIGYMDTLSAGNSPLHRLDPRVKLITTLMFIVAVVSFNKYALSAMTPFFIYPAVLISTSGLPAGYLLKKVLLVSPFAVLVGIFNPVIDKEILLHVGSISVSGGWVSFLSIMLRFVLTVTAALVLIASTGFNSVCDALMKFGVPRPFVAQLLLFHRYIFILTDEAERMLRARSLRTFKSGTMNVKIFVSLISHLLLRTIGRAERIYRAMLCRGFDGRVPVIRKMRTGFREVIFVIGWSFIFVFFRYCNIPFKIGALITGVLR